ncbi:MAG: flavodoxin domain-containing protein [Pseudazoarcus pumilus]|nr:flavodoxin domain-containing protein [Pseudazoarcus pumilus]
MITDQLPRLAGAAGLLAAWCGLCLRAWWGSRTASGRALPAQRGEHTAAPVLIAFASQTGFAHELAEEAALALRAGGVECELAALGEVDAARLRRAGQVLFIASTCREGDAPDNALTFVEHVMNGHPDLRGVRHALLALGDRHYTRFCGFGRELDAWLGDCGAEALFPRIDLDSADPAGLQTWRHRLAEFANAAEAVTEAAASGWWRIRARRHLNPGSVGAAAFHVELEAVAGPQADAATLPIPAWEAGDLLQLLPPGGDHRPRTYSVASLPEDGTAQLLVRAVLDAEGRPGLMSALLCGEAPIGATLRGRIRPHHNFRLGDNATRPLILIGSGTGLAGLLALLRWRARHGLGCNWLLFGERNAAHDAFHAAEIEQLKQQRLLARCDRTYSRDEAGEYVQHRLARSANTLRQWVSDGAAIYVCGNAVGMGPAVHDALRVILGEESLAQLARDGRYRRDLY